MTPDKERLHPPPPRSFLKVVAFASISRSKQATILLLSIFVGVLFVKSSYTIIQLDTKASSQSASQLINQSSKIISLC
jgi:hypothetical protein